MTLVLARVPAARLLRTPRAWLPIIAWSLVAIASAVVAATRGSSSGTDHVMRGTFAYLALPLVSYATVGAVVGSGGLRRGLEGVIALGATPRRAALASAAVAVLSAALTCGVLAALVCVLAHGSDDPPLSRDAPTSLWIGALGGGAYAAYFCAGSAFKKGGMRGVLLAIDFIVGGGSGVGALFTPRGHVLSLLGGPLCAGLSQRSSSVVLVTIVCAYAALALLVTRRA